MSVRDLHIAETPIDATVDRILRFLAEPTRLAEWASGMKEQQVIAPNRVRGVLATSGQTVYCEWIVCAEAGLVSYRLGTTPALLEPRIQIQAIDAGMLGLTGSQLLLMAWRTATMDDARWRELCIAHEAEVLTIKRLLERSG